MCFCCLPQVAAFGTFQLSQGLFHAISFSWDHCNLNESDLDYQEQYFLCFATKTLDDTDDA